MPASNIFYVLHFLVLEWFEDGDITAYSLFLYFFSVRLIFFALFLLLITIVTVADGVAVLFTYLLFTFGCIHLVSILFWKTAALECLRLYSHISNLVVKIFKLLILIPTNLKDASFIRSVCAPFPTYSTNPMDILCGNQKCSRK